MDRGVFILRAEAESTTLAEALDRYLREITLTRKPSTVARETNTPRSISPSTCRTQASARALVVKVLHWMG